MLLEPGAPGKRARATGLLREAMDAGDRLGMLKVKRDAELLLARPGT